MKPSIYIETLIPSFYYEVRTEADNAARRQWTRMVEHLSDYDAYTSEAVIEELEGGSFPGKANALELMEALPLLDINEPIVDIVATLHLISHRVMPNDPAGDALHLAVASFHKCDFLVTWNCRHLANANKFGHIRRINTLFGLFVPALVTPLELLGESS
uniref:PIN domain-containing protein n=1 Tax=Candidatus Kentrum sp. SD TaxID=2126332 RepID=A0A450Z7P9_9GAMM|nr:MAG: PIN domain-containing protein [Candidatus Kentron sp. SD]VFK49837.1 MAG: PIN domain-containing protein [Candidatus Kentron sp. SD]VFK81173.1 MAG: PIN domain-containing protein [Candidatus Kentron sp. SD]